MFSISDDLRSCEVGEYWFHSNTDTINAALYCKRSFYFPTGSLPDWCGGIERGRIEDVVTNDDGTEKFFKVQSTERRNRKTNYISCNLLISSQHICWEFFKGQSDRNTIFNGRALFGRTIKKPGMTCDGTIIECRDTPSGFVYTVEFSKKHSEHLSEDVMLKYLCA
jgi:hypothetical protein